MTKTRDPRVQSLIDQLEQLALARHGSRRRWAISAGVHPTQVSNLLNARTGASLERLLDLAAAAGATFGVLAAGAAPRPLSVGTIGPTGRLVTTEGALIFPGVATIGAAFGPFGAGDELRLVPARDFASGQWILVQIGANHELFQSVTVDMAPHLRRPDYGDLRWERERHTIVARVESRTVAM